MKLPVKPATQIDWQAPAKRLAERLTKQKSLEELVREMRWRRWAAAVKKGKGNKDETQNLR